MHSKTTFIFAALDLMGWVDQNIEAFVSQLLSNKSGVT